MRLLKGSKCIAKAHNLFELEDLVRSFMMSRGWYVCGFISQGYEKVITEGCWSWGVKRGSLSHSESLGGIWVFRKFGFFRSTYKAYFHPNDLVKDDPLFKPWYKRIFK